MSTYRRRRWAALAVLGVTVLATLAAAAPAEATIGRRVAVGEQWQIHLTPAGQAAARTAVLKRVDLNPKSKFTGGSTKPNLHETWCANFHPKQADLVVIGAAASAFSWSDGSKIATRAVVLKTAEMVRLDWQRSVTPQGLACERSKISKELAKQTTDDASARLVSLRKIAFPQLATYTTALRARVDVKSEGKTVRIMVDEILLGHGRTEISLTTRAGLAYKLGVTKVETEFARRVVARAAASGLEAGALTATALPHATVDHVHGTASDLTAATPGGIAAFSRIFSFENAKNPAYEFVIEELVATPNPAAAAKAFARLEHASHTRSGRARLGAVISDMYMATVFLPVSLSPAKTVTAKIGDEAIEMFLNGHSSCCSFESAVLVIRAHTTIAVIYAGGVNTLDHAKLTRLATQAAAQLETVS